MKIGKRFLIILIIVFVLLLGSVGFGSYFLGNSNGYQSGHVDGYSQGHSDGYKQGNLDGYGHGYQQGQSDGYSQGYSAAGGAIQDWVSQNCFNYPFLLLDTSQYMACHRYQ